MLKKICRMRYFITFAVVLTVLMSVYGIIRFHYKNITVSNTTPVNYEGFKILAARKFLCLPTFQHSLMKK